MPLVRRSGSRALVAGVLVVLCTVAGGGGAPHARAPTTANRTREQR
jgi:hypothetical protein